VAPKKYAKWLDALAQPLEFTAYRDLSAVADRLQKNNARLARDQAMFLASHWAEVMPDGSARLTSDPRHKLPFPSVYRMEEVYAIWRAIVAPVLWVAATESDVPKWLGEHPEAEAGTDNLAGVRRRLAQVPGGVLVTVADAGHMLHHDQPEAVAAAIESFIAAAGAL
jgi:pimeloyl-ACP methyl ester carboxylesterase